MALIKVAPCLLADTQLAEGLIDVVLSAEALGFLPGLLGGGHDHPASRLGLSQLSYRCFIATHCCSWIPAESAVSSAALRRLQPCLEARALLPPPLSS